MIAKITFNRTDGAQEAMLFGGSYKDWEQQFEEYVQLHWSKLLTVETAETSRSQWVAWGGLKWCPAERFQEELNREGCQEGEPDNPSPRQFTDMVFTADNQALAYTISYLSKARERFDPQRYRR